MSSGSSLLSAAAGPSRPTDTALSPTAGAWLSEPPGASPSRVRGRHSQPRRLRGADRHPRLIGLVPTHTPGAVDAAASRPGQRDAVVASAGISPNGEVAAAVHPGRGQTATAHLPHGHAVSPAGGAGQGASHRLDAGRRRQQRGQSLHGLVTGAPPSRSSKQSPRLRRAIGRADRLSATTRPPTAPTRATGARSKIYKGLPFDPLRGPNGPLREGATAGR